MQNKLKILTLFTLSFLLFTNLSAYEIIIDKTLKVKQEKTKSSYTYLPLQRDNTKEIAYDPVTKLQWQDNSEAKSTEKNWEGAKSYCRDLNFAGYSDWRLPDIDELLSITDDTRYEPAIKRGFKNVVSDGYWSSSAYVSNAKEAWDVSFYFGSDYWNDKTYNYYVRCVRDR